MSQSDQSGLSSDHHHCQPLFVSTMSTSGSRRSSRTVAKISYVDEDVSDDGPSSVAPKPRRQRAKMAVEDESVAEDELADSKATKPPKKKRMTRKSAGKSSETQESRNRRKRGVLQEFIGLPLDILYEARSILLSKIVARY